MFPKISALSTGFGRGKRLAIQASVREGGGNDGAMINTSLDGVPVIVAGVPVRYIHSTNCMTSYFDFEATVQFVVALIQSLTEEQIKQF